MRKKISLGMLLLVCTGCQVPVITSDTETSISTSEVEQVTILVSEHDPSEFCNGADMDSESYRETLVAEEEIEILGGQSDIERVRLILSAATTGQCSNLFNDDPDRTLVIQDSVLYIPHVSGWAGVSITMCHCEPEVEVNALRLSGISSVVWDTYDND